MTTSMNIIAEYIPTRGSQYAAGYDLYSTEDVLVPERGSAVVSTKTFMEIPPGHYGQIASRSGLAFKYDIYAFAGIIDEDYRGEIKVKLINHSDIPFTIGDKDRIAQIIFHKYNTFDFNVVKSLEESKRGDAGFGSSGN